MSYILDALRKADRERQRGSVPTLQGEPVLATAPAQSTYVIYVLIAVALLAAGIGIGWWQPWRDAAPVVAALPASAAPLPVAAGPVQAPTPPVPIVPPPAPPVVQLPAVTAPVAPPAPVSPVVAPPVVAAPVAPLITVPLPATGKMAEAAVPPVEILALEDLPPAVRQELPVLTVQLHAYSSVAKERLVSLNDKLLREGDHVSPTLRLEQITKDGMIFSFKGYRFRRGVQ